MSGLLHYHATHVAKLPSIFKSGLVPDVGPRSAACGEDVPRVYLFPRLVDCEDALCNWLGEELFDEEGSPAQEVVVVEVDVSGIAGVVSVGYEFSCCTVIPPERIVRLLDEDLSPIPLLRVESFK